MTYSNAYYQLKDSLTAIYGTDEATAIAHQVMEHITGLDRLGRLAEKDTPLAGVQHSEWQRIQQGLLAGKPMQHALGYAWFMGRKYEVNGNVLIPRPETEELVQWITDDWQGRGGRFAILDVGTGSGCIPVSLAGALPNAVVTACDISEDALAIAQKNALANHQHVQFLKTDILNSKDWQVLPQYNVIVSNPPYIPLSEKQAMDANVKDHDPHLALFVPDEDPLVFYKAIARLGLCHLAPGGAIYCEIHQDLGAETEQLFKGYGYKTELKKDIFDNDRMVKSMILKY